MLESGTTKIPVLSWDDKGNCSVGYTYYKIDADGGSDAEQPSVIIDISKPLSDNPELDHEYAKGVLTASIGAASTILGAGGKEALPGGAIFTIITSPINVLYDIQYGNESVAQALVSQGLAVTAALAATYGVLAVSTPLGLSGAGLPVAIAMSAAST